MAISWRAILLSRIQSRSDNIHWNACFFLQKVMNKTWFQGQGQSWVHIRHNMFSITLVSDIGTKLGVQVKTEALWHHSPSSKELTSSWHWNPNLWLSSIVLSPSKFWLFVLCFILELLIGLGLLSVPIMSTSLVASWRKRNQSRFQWTTFCLVWGLAARYWPCWCAWLLGRVLATVALA